MTDDLFDTALELAESADEEVAVARGGGPSAVEQSLALRPLLGVPVSIKDNMDIKGMDSTCGLACRALKPARSDGVLVTMLKEAGAIPLCKTNVPQCLMLPASDNLVFGRTDNPWNKERTCGGSSGGEAALVASRASPLGLGTDVGGSVRIPALFCGCYGLKPTAGRFPSSGSSRAPRPTGYQGRYIIRASAGPLANKVEDLAAMLRCWAKPSLWRRLPSLFPPVPFDEGMYRGKRKTRQEGAVALDVTTAASSAGKLHLRVAYWEQDGWSHVDEPTVHALRTARDALVRASSAGELGFTVEIVDFEEEIRGISWDACRIFFSANAAEGGMQGFFSGLEGEALHPMYDEMAFIAGVPNAARPAIAALLRSPLLGEERKAMLFEAARGMSTKEYWAVEQEVQMLRSRFLNLWQAKRIDAMLCPGTGPAMKHELVGKLLTSCLPLFMWNLLDFP